MWSPPEWMVHLLLGLWPNDFCGGSVGLDQHPAIHRLQAECEGGGGGGDRYLGTESMRQLSCPASVSRSPYPGALEVTLSAALLMEFSHRALALSTNRAIGRPVFDPRHMARTAYYRAVAAPSELSTVPARRLLPRKEELPHPPLPSPATPGVVNCKNVSATQNVYCSHINCHSRWRLGSRRRSGIGWMGLSIPGLGGRRDLEKRQIK